MRFPYKIIDLTHALDSSIPSWNGSCGFYSEIKCDYDDCQGDVKFRVQQIKMHAGIGTHIDASVHCVLGGKTVGDLALEQLAAPCVMLDVSQQAHERYSLTVKDIKLFEQTHGMLPAKSFVIVRTGWEDRWHDAKAYRNNYVFPSVTKEAAEYLLECDIVGLGIDTLSPDRPEDEFSVHALLLGAGKYIIENVANGGALPAVGSFSLALPMKIKEGSEAPVRLVAIM